jgi:hypothetical protein
MWTVTEQEGKVTFAGPAPIVNRFIALPTPDGLRISFLEQGTVGGEVFFRSAVFVSYVNAALLKDLLERMIPKT